MQRERSLPRRKSHSTRYRLRQSAGSLALHCPLVPYVDTRLASPWPAHPLRRTPTGRRWHQCWTRSLAPRCIFACCRLCPLDGKPAHSATNALSVARSCTRPSTSQRTITLSKSPCARASICWRPSGSHAPPRPPLKSHAVAPFHARLPEAEGSSPTHPRPPARKAVACATTAGVACVAQGQGHRACRTERRHQRSIACPDSTERTACASLSPVIPFGDVKCLKLIWSFTNCAGPWMRRCQSSYSRPMRPKCHLWWRK